MEGSPSGASMWFVEANGAKQGPYSAQKLFELVTAGELDTESTVTHYQTGALRSVEAVLQEHFATPQPPPPPNHAKLPPRPPELRDVHVVDLNAERTENIDYYALISDRKAGHGHAHAHIQPHPVTPPHPHPVQHHAPAQSQAPTHAQGQAHAAHEQGPATNAVQTPAAAAALNISPADELIAPPKPENKWIRITKKVFASVFKLLWGILKGIGSLANQYKWKLATAGLFCAVAYGLYFGARTYIDKRKREPAATPPPAAAKLKEPAPAAVESGGQDSLGQGRIHSARAGGGVARGGAPTPPLQKVMPANPNPPVPAPEQPRAPEPPRNDPPNEAPVATAAPPVESPPAPVPPPAPAEGPNDGAVQPPGYIPPADAGAQPPDPGNQPPPPPTPDGATSY